MMKIPDIGQLFYVTRKHIFVPPRLAGGLGGKRMVAVWDSYYNASAGAGREEQAYGHSNQQDLQKPEEKTGQIL